MTVEPTVERESGDPLIVHLRREKRLIFGIAIATIIGAILAAVLIRPVYRTTATLIAADDSAAATMGVGSMLGGLGSLASLAGVNFGSDQQKVEAEALLQSRQFTEAFIRDENLLPRLFSRRWDAENKAWIIGLMHRQPPTLFDGFTLFDEHIRDLTEDKKTGIITLTIDWTDREEGARWANELVHRVNESMRQRAIREAEASIELLSNRLESATEVELRQAISSAIEIYVKQRTLASVRTEYAFRVIDPAMPPDGDDFVWPQRTVFLVLAPFVGFGLGIGLVAAKLRIRRLLGSGR